MSLALAVFLVLGLLGVFVTPWFQGHAMPIAPLSAWFSAFQLALLVAVIGGFYALLRRRLPVRLFWELFFFVLAIFGFWFLCFSLIPSAGVAFFVSLFVTALPALIPRVFVSNLFFAIGALGAAMLIVPRLGFEALSILCLGLAAYDLFVTGEHGPFGSMRASLLSKNIFPGFLLPEKKGQWWASLSALPHTISYFTVTELTIFTSLFVRLSLRSWQLGVIVLGIAVLFGLMAISFRKIQHARNLIPWLAAGTVLPIVAFRLLGYL